MKCSINTLMVTNSLNPSEHDKELALWLKPILANEPLGIYPDKSSEACKTQINAASLTVAAAQAAFWRNRSGSVEVISNTHFHSNNNSFASVHGGSDPGRLLLMWGRGFHDTGDGIGISEIRQSSRIEYWGALRNRHHDDGDHAGEDICHLVQNCAHLRLPCVEFLVPVIVRRAEAEVEADRGGGGGG
ncbi:hypothetical protein ACLOJK_041312 [Asimina triloba]